jgi:hypothetical protein
MLILAVAIFAEAAAVALFAVYAYDAILKFLYYIYE